MDETRPTRALAPVLFATLLLQMGATLYAVIVPLALEARGVSALLNGATAGVYALGFIAGSLTAPIFVRNVGHLRSFAGFAAVAVIAALALGVNVSFLASTIVRGVLGLCIASMLTVTETWVVAMAPAAQRGSLSSLYYVLVKLAIIAAPFVVVITGTAILPVFMICAAVFALAIVPIALTPTPEPARPHRARLRLLTVFKAAPTAFVGVIGAGLVNGGVFALFPIYAQRVGLGAAGLAEIMAATQITSLVLQWPLGRLSDHRDRRQVILGLMLTGAVTGLILAWLTDFAPPWALIVAAGAWGAASFTFYGICVAHAVDQLESQDITKVGATLLFLFSIGQMLGPLIGGAAMGVGAAGLFIYAGVTHLLLAVFVAVRIRMQARQSYEEGFEALTTTTPQLAYLDPRYEGVEEEDDFDPERDVRATD